MPDILQAIAARKAMLDMLSGGLPTNVDPALQLQAQMSMPATASGFNRPDVSGIPRSMGQRQMDRASSAAPWQPVLGGVMPTPEPQPDMNALLAAAQLASASVPQTDPGFTQTDFGQDPRWLAYMDAARQRQDFARAGGDMSQLPAMPTAMPVSPPPGPSGEQLAKRQAYEQMRGEKVGKRKELVAERGERRGLAREFRRQGTLPYLLQQLEGGEGVNPLMLGALNPALGALANQNIGANANMLEAQAAWNATNNPLSYAVRSPDPVAFMRYLQGEGGGQMMPQTPASIRPDLYVEAKDKTSWPNYQQFQVAMKARNYTDVEIALAWKAARGEDPDAPGFWERWFGSGSGKSFLPSDQDILDLFRGSTPAREDSAPTTMPMPAPYRRPTGRA